MANWGVIPSIRVRDLSRALDCYRDSFGFTVSRGGPEDVNCSLAKGDARVMLEVPTTFYSPEYNEAIARRLNGHSAMALYIEESDLDGRYATVRRAGLTIVDPLAARPWGQSEFTVEDTEGNWLTFWQASATP